MIRADLAYELRLFFHILDGMSILILITLSFDLTR